MDIDYSNLEYQVIFQEIQYILNKKYLPNKNIKILNIIENYFKYKIHTKNLIGKFMIYNIILNSLFYLFYLRLKLLV